MIHYNKINISTASAHLFAAFTILSSCTHQPADKTSGEYDSDTQKLDSTLVNRGRLDAMHALSFEPGSRGREQAILEIRIAEQRLRVAGMKASAKAYASGADEVFEREQ